MYPNQEQPTAYRFQGSAAIEIERPYIHHRLPYIRQRRLLERIRQIEQRQKKETSDFCQQQSKGGQAYEAYGDIQEPGKELFQ